MNLSCLSFLPLLCFTFVIQHAGLADASSDINSITLMPHEYTIRWFTTGIQPNDMITFELIVATRGRVGFGFHQTGLVQKTDFILYEPTTNKLQDCHTNGVDSHLLVDTSQDYELLASRTNTTHTSVKIRRKLATCDPDDLDIDNSTTKLVWFYSQDEEISISDINITEAVNLLLLAPMEPEADGAISVADNLFEIRMNNVSIPSDKATWYWCKIFELPEFTNTTYLLGYEPLIQETTRKYIHHFDIYHCIGDTAASKVGKEGECYENPESPVFGLCTERFITFWTPGKGSTFYPEEFGFPLRPFQSRYIRVEAYYDNGNLDNNIPLDNSGMKLFFTNRPQQNNLGSLVVRVATSNESLIIPPKLTHFTLYSFCTADCTKKLPREGVKLISGHFHAHALGSAFLVRHIRNGIELPFILNEKNYDREYQRRHLFSEPVTILPNDVILMECSFNSVNGTHVHTSRTKATLGGFSTWTNEMCSVILEYYPKVDGFGGCVVSLTPETLAEALKTPLIRNAAKPAKVNVLSPNSDSIVSIADFTQEYDWLTDTKNLLLTFQELTKHGHYNLKCGGTSQMSSNGSKTEVQKTVLFPHVPVPFPTSKELSLAPHC